MELKLYIQQLPQQNSQGAQIHYAGLNPQSLQATPGPLPTGSVRRWPSYGTFIEATQYVSDITKLKLQWSAQRAGDGGIVPGGFQPVKGTSGILTFEGLAYDLIKKWLVDDVSAPLNAVSVKILDTSCGYYEGYVIKPGDLQWCEGGLCTFDINLKQQDEALNCMKRTIIADNWQGWFPPDSGKPANGKKHPRFSYCKEQRPNGMMITLWYVMAQVMAPFVLILFGLSLAINAMIFAINGVIAVINALGGNVNYLQPLNPLGIFDSFNIYFIETAGCGREHPAPLIRDYITNVCDKCGIKVDNITAPIFFASQISIETSTRGIIQTENPHYNACYFFPQSQRGIRRFNSINMLSSSTKNTDDFWIPENMPLLYLDTFLDQIKGMYNAEWRVKNGKLYFWRKDWFKSTNPIYDFTTNAPDRLKILEGICFEPNELKYPASCKGVYATDASDMNEAGGGNGTGQMNGFVEFGDTDDNPNFEGMMDKTQQFGATKFNLDGASTCYYKDAMQQLANAGLLNLTTLLQVALIRGAFRDYADYALLLQNELTALPKILIWDGNDYINARCVKPKAAWDGIASEPMPTPNVPYNNKPGIGTQLWKQKHAPKTFVVGSALTLGTAPDGVYEVTNYFGAPIDSQPAMLVNYPLYFEPGYEDTLWDWFHWIDDPKRNPVMNLNWRVKIKLCCDDIKHLGVDNDGSNNALLQVVKLPSVYYQNGLLKEIEVSYNPSDTYGMYIQLSGTL